MINPWLGTTPEILIPRLERLARDLEEISRNHHCMSDGGVLLEDFFLCQRSVPCLAGRMFGHPEIDNGSPGFTSELFYLDTERRIARTLSRWYRLGGTRNLKND